MSRLRAVALQSAIINAAYFAAIANEGDKVENPKTSQTEGSLDSLIPDRLCIERNSRFHSPALAFIGVRVNGVERADVVEYCVSGGWVRIGQLDKSGRATPKRPGSAEMIAERREGVSVEPYFKSAPSRQVRRELERRKARCEG